MSEEEVAQRKQHVLSTLLQHHLPVEEQGSQLLVMGLLTIEPPFLPRNCRCSNGIVLNRVKKLLETS